MKNIPRFWLLRSPDYNSDYDHTLINGSLEHPFGIPGVNCSVCGATWGGSRILSVACPDSLRKRKELTDRWPIALEAHKKLQTLVQRELAMLGLELEDLFPGDQFQPGYRDVPYRPRADFLWCSIGSLVVSQRIKNLLEDSGLIDVAFSKIIMRKVGNRESNRPAPIPKTGEPEDLINEVSLLKSTADLGPYYEMI